MAPSCLRKDRRLADRDDFARKGNLRNATTIVAAAVRSRIVQMVYFAKIPLRSWETKGNWLGGLSSVAAWVASTPLNPVDK
jgi:hypothetical protein